MDFAPGTTTPGLPLNRVRTLNRARNGLEFRTLSIQVYQSMAAPADKQKRLSEQTPQLFENVQFHKLCPVSICQQYNTHPDRGLDAAVAARRLQRDGRNTLTTRKNHYFQKIFWYIFGGASSSSCLGSRELNRPPPLPGFCSVLWVGVIIFFVCWRPLSNPPSPTNLALAIVVRPRAFSLQRRRGC